MIAAGDDPGRREPIPIADAPRGLAEQALVARQSEELLGRSATESGHSRVPAPPDNMTGIRLLPAVSAMGSVLRLSRDHRVNRRFQEIFVNLSDTIGPVGETYTTRKAEQADDPAVQALCAAHRAAAGRDRLRFADRGGRGGLAAAPVADRRRSRTRRRRRAASAHLRGRAPARDGRGRRLCGSTPCTRCGSPPRG